MTHQPTIIIVDMAHVVAAHGNARCPGMFQPNDGRVTEASHQNIRAAQEGSLTVPLPCLQQTTCYPEEHISVTFDHTYDVCLHPSTEVTDNYCLFDKLHETNTKQEAEVLRRTLLIPQLNGFIKH